MSHILKRFSKSGSVVFCCFVLMYMYQDKSKFCDLQHLWSRKHDFMTIIAIAITIIVIIAKNVVLEALTSVQNIKYKVQTTLYVNH